MGDLNQMGGAGSDLALALRLQSIQHWPYMPVLMRIALAVALGLFVGMERERRGKEAGMRTFAFAALLGCLCSLLGDAYALLGMGLLGVLIVFLNWQRLVTNQTAELTTSVALMVTGVMGILCGKGHDFTPVVVGIFAAALLAWKERMTHFSIGLTETELRSAILLAILAFIVYPVLPSRALDPWGLIEPRSAWVTVLLIAAVGFGNYVLLKLYGTRGAVLAGFLAGLVNSTVAVTELANRAREPEREIRRSAEGARGDIGAPSFVEAAYQGFLLAVSAMLLRNGVLLLILAPAVLLRGAVLPLLLMLSASAALAYFAAPQTRGATREPSPAPADLAGLADLTALSGEPHDCPEGCQPEPPEASSAPAASVRLESPFSLSSALKFGLIFLALHAGGTLAQRWLGEVGFYGVSVAGGIVSSSSAVASAGSMASQGTISAVEAGVGAVLASLASALVNLPLVARIARQPRLTARVARALLIIGAAGIIGCVLQVLASVHGLLLS